MFNIVNKGFGMTKYKNDTQPIYQEKMGLDFFYLIQSVYKIMKKGQRFCS